MKKHHTKRITVECSSELEQLIEHSRRVSRLTPSQRAVMGRLASGCCPKAASKELGIRPATFHRHLANARDRLNVRQNAEAVVLVTIHRIFSNETNRNSPNGILLGSPRISTNGNEEHRKAGTRTMTQQGETP